MLAILLALVLMVLMMYAAICTLNEFGNTREPFYAILSVAFTALCIILLCALMHFKPWLN